MERTSLNVSLDGFSTDGPPNWLSSVNSPEQGTLMPPWSPAQNSPKSGQADLANGTTDAARLTHLSSHSSSLLGTKAPAAVKRASPSLEPSHAAAVTTTVASDVGNSGSSTVASGGGGRNGGGSSDRPDLGPTSVTLENTIAAPRSSCRSSSTRMSEAVTAQKAITSSEKPHHRTAGSTTRLDSAVPPIVAPLLTLPLPSSGRTSPLPAWKGAAAAASPLARSELTASQTQSCHEAYPWECHVKGQTERDRVPSVASAPVLPAGGSQSAPSPIPPKDALLGPPACLACSKCGTFMTPAPLQPKNHAAQASGSTSPTLERQKDETGSGSIGTRYGQAAAAADPCELSVTLGLPFLRNCPSSASATLSLLVLPSEPAEANSVLELTMLATDMSPLATPLQTSMLYSECGHGSVSHREACDLSVSLWLQQLVPVNVADEAEAETNLLSLAHASVTNGIANSNSLSIHSGETSFATEMSVAMVATPLHSGSLGEAVEEVDRERRTSASSSSSAPSSKSSTGSASSRVSSIPSILIRSSSALSSRARRLARQQSTLTASVVEPDFNKILQAELNQRLEARAQDMQPMRMVDAAWLKQEGTRPVGEKDTAQVNAERDCSSSGDETSSLATTEGVDANEFSVLKRTFSYKEYKAVPRRQKMNESGSQPRAWSISTVLTAQLQAKDSASSANGDARAPDTKPSSALDNNSSCRNANLGTVTPVEGPALSVLSHSTTTTLARTTSQRLLSDFFTRNQKSCTPISQRNSEMHSCSLQKTHVKRRGTLEHGENNCLGGSLMLDEKATTPRGSNYGSMVLRPSGHSVAPSSGLDDRLPSMCVDQSPMCLDGAVARRTQSVVQRRRRRPSLTSLGSMHRSAGQPSVPQTRPQPQTKDSTEPQHVNLYAIQPEYFSVEAPSPASKAALSSDRSLPPHQQQHYQCRVQQQQLPLLNSKLRRSKGSYAMPVLEAGAATQPEQELGQEDNTGRAPVTGGMTAATSNGSKKLGGRSDKKSSKSRSHGRNGKVSKSTRRSGHGSTAWPLGKSKRPALGVPPAMVGWGGPPQVTTSPQVPFLPLNFPSVGSQSVGTENGSMSLQSSNTCASKDANTASRNPGERSDSTFWNVGGNRTPRPVNSGVDIGFGKPMTPTTSRMAPGTHVHAVPQQPSYAGGVRGFPSGGGVFGTAMPPMGDTDGAARQPA